MSDQSNIEELKKIVKNLVIDHDPEENRFVARLPTGEQCLLEYSKSKDGIIDFYHIEVPPSYRGTGLSQKLAQYCLDFAKQHHWRIAASCPWIGGKYLVGDTLEKYRDIIAK